MARLARLPIRVRVTLAFAGAMALVLAAMGLFLVLRLGAELDRAIEQGLRSRAADVAALVRGEGAGLAASARSPLTEEDESSAQIVDGDGRIVDSTADVRGVPLLPAADLTRARRRTIIVGERRVRGLDEPVRVLATPVRGADERLVVVVAAALDDRHDAVRNLARLLLIGGPAALLLASLAGYGAAAAALAPVERMRRRAAAIGPGEPGRRLPVPPARDEVGRLGATLNDMLARLEAAFARERTFVADASHELRTPLAILKAELELARRRGRTADELYAALDSAAEETDRLVQLAEDLLVIARADQGKLPIRPEARAAGELLAAVRERFAGRAGEQGASIAHDPAGDLVLEADPLRVEQAVGNLVDNALRHGGGAVRLRAEGAGTMVRLLVADDGPGFPPGLAGSAFERFTRGDSARGRAGGAGLGLAIVAAIAHAHGGGVGARDVPGGGAEVWLEVPQGAPGTLTPCASSSSKTT
jgi:two-component system, OmpR family, sensor kinase